MGSQRTSKGRRTSKGGRLSDEITPIGSANVDPALGKGALAGARPAAREKRAIERN